MEYTKTPKTIILSDINHKELFGIIKSQINCKLNFIKNDNILYSIKLLKRTINGTMQTIEIETLESPKQIVAYSTLMNLITENQQIGILTIEIDKQTFKDKEPLIVISDSIKSEIIESCIYMDYEPKVGLFSVINRNLNNGFSDKLYFFENNNTILFFGKEGPNLVYNEKITSIEDLICN
ncbi:hypothetical protein M0Q97_08110 [Candidatus Dojkabacteria bacterium]|jgi:hypothetical protein|nr:hypothetical protein [Candidatus Dojkabacteria bacterium]